MQDFKLILSYISVQSVTLSLPTAPFPCTTCALWWWWVPIIKVVGGSLVAPQARVLLNRTLAQTDKGSRTQRWSVIVQGQWLNWPSVCMFAYLALLFSPLLIYSGPVQAAADVYWLSGGSCVLFVFSPPYLLSPGLKQMRVLIWHKLQERWPKQELAQALPSPVLV